jgi:hypothetical protein
LVQGNAVCMFHGGHPGPSLTYVYRNGTSGHRDALALPTLHAACRRSFAKLGLIRSFL